MAKLYVTRNVSKSIFQCNKQQVNRTSNKQVMIDLVYNGRSRGGGGIQPKPIDRAPSNRSAYLDSFLKTLFFEFVSL